MINEQELGPCRRGCPYTPMRKSQAHSTGRSGMNCFPRHSLMDSSIFQRIHDGLSLVDHLFCRYHLRMNSLRPEDGANTDRERGIREAQESREGFLSMNAHDDPRGADESEPDDAPAPTHDCNVERGEGDESSTPKRRSMGFLASFFSCGIVVGFTESIVCEGPRTVTDHLLSMQKYGACLPDALVCKFESISANALKSRYSMAYFRRCSMSTQTILEPSIWWPALSRHPVHSKTHQHESSRGSFSSEGSCSSDVQNNDQR